MGKELIRHAVRNFLAALVIFAVAFGLAYVEKWCGSYNMPAYLCKGVKIISLVLFVIDGIVVCGTAAITAIRLLLRTWGNSRED